jgi:hypothetical protein
MQKKDLLMQSHKQILDLMPSWMLIRGSLVHALVQTAESMKRQQERLGECLMTRT